MATKAKFKVKTSGGSNRAKQQAATARGIRADLRNLGVKTGSGK